MYKPRLRAYDEADYDNFLNCRELLTLPKFKGFSIKKNELSNEIRRNILGITMMSLDEFHFLIHLDLSFPYVSLKIVTKVFLLHFVITV